MFGKIIDGRFEEKYVTVFEEKTVDTPVETVILFMHKEVVDPDRLKEAEEYSEEYLEVILCEE